MRRPARNFWIAMTCWCSALSVRAGAHETKTAAETLAFDLTLSGPGLLPGASKSALLIGFLLITVLAVLAFCAGGSLAGETREDRKG